MNPWFTAYLQAIDWVKQAGDKLRRDISTPFDVSTKSNHRDLVTQYDIATEQFLTEKLTTHYPNHRIFGEEAQSAGKGDTFTDLNGPVWFLDPIDGTINFVKQRRNFGIMLALYVDGEAQIGIVYDVMCDALYSSLKGHGSYCNGRQLAPLPTVSLKDSLVIIEGSAICLCDPHTLAVLPHCLSARMVGSSAIVTTYLATASAGAFLSKKQMPWDAAAPRAILEEIGARFTHPDGTPPTLLHAEPILMALPGISEEIIALYPATEKHHPT